MKKRRFLVKCMSHCGELLHGQLAILVADNLNVDESRLVPGLQVSFGTQGKGNSFAYIVAELKDELPEGYEQACMAKGHDTSILTADYVFDSMGR